MRTFKALACLAVLAAGVATSMAQSNVYSLNVVGYYNVPVAAGQMVVIANQLNTTNNTIGSLLQPPMVNDGDFIYKYVGGSFVSSFYSTDDGQWDTAGGGSGNSITMNPGEALFYKGAKATTLTFVGEVLQGSLSNNLPLGTLVQRSSMVPQQGKISADLGVTPADGDFLYKYIGGAYVSYFYSTDDGYWEQPGNPAQNEPVIDVGQGFFYKKAANAPAASAAWVRNFTVQ